MERLSVKSLNSPDEVRTFENGKVELVKVGKSVVGRIVLKPGWKWSKNVKPIANTEWCEAPHFQYQESGTLKIVMKDGTERETKAGDVASVPPGHDAWVVGKDSVVLVDFQGLVEYAKPSKGK